MSDNYNVLIDHIQYIKSELIFYIVLYLWYCMKFCKIKHYSKVILCL